MGGCVRFHGFSKRYLRVSQSHMRHACDASVPEILETHGALAFKSGKWFPVLSRRDVSRMM